MKDDNLRDSYKGEKFTIIHCKGALDSYRLALGSVEARKHKSFTRGIIMQVERLAAGHRMSKQNFPQEGYLPKRKGHKAKKFNALKRIPIRGYCWLSEQHKNTYFISHYVLKDYDKLKQSDTNKVAANWSRIEVNGDGR